LPHFINHWSIAMFNRVELRSLLRFPLTLTALAAAGTIMAFAAPAQAQDKYPSRAIRLVVGFAPGGPTDVQARLLAIKLGPILGQSVIVDNKPGASTTIAMSEVARAQADGYTLYFGGSGAYATTPLTMPSLPYDSVKSFKPVAMVGEEQIAFAVNPAVPAQNMSELASLIRATPGKYAYGSSGQGNITHLTGELFKHRVGGLDLMHSAYKGAAPAVNDALAGHVGIVVGGLSSVYPLHQQKKLRVLAITSAKRVPYAPDIPTMGESGVKDLVATSTLVMLAPAGTPDSVVTALSSAVNQATSQAAYQQEMRNGYVEPVGTSTPSRTSELLAHETELWSSLVKAAKLKLD